MCYNNRTRTWESWCGKTYKTYFPPANITSIEVALDVRDLWFGCWAAGVFSSNRGSLSGCFYPFFTVRPTVLSGTASQRSRCQQWPWPRQVASTPWLYVLLIYRTLWFMDIFCFAGHRFCLFLLLWTLYCIQGPALWEDGPVVPVQGLFNRRKLCQCEGNEDICVFENCTQYPFAFHRSSPAGATRGIQLNNVLPPTVPWATTVIWPGMRRSVKLWSDFAVPQHRIPLAAGEVNWNLSPWTRWAFERRRSNFSRNWTALRNHGGAQIQLPRTILAAVRVLLGQNVFCFVQLKPTG